MNEKRIKDKEVAHSEIGSFWRPISLNELIERQGIEPVKEISEISQLWPADDDPEELFQFILNERSERRNLGRKG